MSSQPFLALVTVWKGKVNSGSAPSKVLDTLLEIHLKALVLIRAEVLTCAFPICLS